MPFGTDEHSEQNEAEALELSEVREEGVVLADDDSQQAAEAMVQLGNVGFYMGEQQLLQQGKKTNFKRLIIDFSVALFSNLLLWRN